MSPLGSSRAAAGGPAGAERRLVGGQNPLLTDGRPYWRQLGPRVSNAALPAAGRCPPRERGGVVGPNTCRKRRASSRRASAGRRQVVARSRAWSAPGPFPADQDRSGGRRMPDAVADTEHPCDLTIGHAAIAEYAGHPGGHLFRNAASPRVVRIPTQREDREVRLRDDVGAEPRSPHLDE